MKKIKLEGKFLFLLLPKEKCRASFVKSIRSLSIFKDNCII